LTEPKGGRTHLEIVHARINKPLRVGLDVAVAARSLVELGAALAGTAAGVKAVPGSDVIDGDEWSCALQRGCILLHDLPLAGDLLVVDPLAQSLHAGRKLLGVFE
jgi:hypothetical protein